jgi:hypothetical protein
VGGMRSARINVAVQEKRRHPEMERVTISVLAAVKVPLVGWVWLSAVKREAEEDWPLRRFPSIL